MHSFLCCSWTIVLKGAPSPWTRRWAVGRAGCSCPLAAAACPSGSGAAAPPSARCRWPACRTGSCRWKRRTTGEELQQKIGIVAEGKVWVLSNVFKFINLSFSDLGLLCSDSKSCTWKCESGQFGVAISELSEFEWAPLSARCRVPCLRTDHHTFGRVHSSQGS